MKPIRTFKYLVDNDPEYSEHEDDENKESDDLSDDERFTKEDYSKFNFPAQNSQGLTSDYSKGTC